MSTPFLSYIINNIISKINYKLEVVSVDNTTNTIYVKDLYFTELNNYLLFIVGGIATQVEIKRADRLNQSIELHSLPIYDTIEMPRPKYISGTRYATNREFIQSGLVEEDKLPLIWLHFSPFPTEELAGDAKPWHSIWRGVSLFFADNYNVLDWTTSEQIEYKLLPLRSLVFSFIESIKRQVCCLEIQDNVIIKHFPVFGTESANGIEKRILDADLSAVNLLFDLKVKRCK
jgi:hypothetical protein